MKSRTSKIKAYLESRDVTALADKTRELYAFALRHLERYFNRLRPENPSEFNYLAELQQNFDGFARYLERRGISGQSVRQYLTCVKIFMRWAGYRVDHVYKISNQERRENKLKQLKRWMNEKEIQMCLDYNFPDRLEATQTVYKSIVRLLIETGARVGEISNIQKKDINLDDKWVTIQGKTEPRPVFFSSITASMLSEVMINIRFEDDRVFPSVDSIKAVVTEMLNNCGLKRPKDGRGPHTFRHFAATHLFYDGGMRIEDIAYLLGDTVDIIRERYLHPTPKMLRKRVSKAMGWND